MLIVMYELVDDDGQNIVFGRNDIVKNIVKILPKIITKIIKTLSKIIN